MVEADQLSNGKENGTIRFGVFEMDSRAGELRRNGIRVKLQDQPFQVLAMLLERPGEVVTREELQRRLWSADTFVDFDHSLNAAVKRLRDALGDSADNPRFVETLARRGYRFLAPVNGPALNGHAAEVLAGSPEKGRSRKWAIAVMAVAAAACISVGWHFGNRSARPVLPREVRLTANSSDAPVYYAAISPDGRYLAYVDPRGTFVREIATDELHGLTLPEGFRVNSVRWFPDGSHLLAEAVSPDQDIPGLWNIPMLGGAPRKLVDEGLAGNVSPDGKQVAFLRGGKFNHSEIWLMSADGGQPRLIQNVPGFVVGAPVWSPDSRRIAYVKDVDWSGYSTGEEDVRIETYEVATGKTDVTLADYRLQYGLAWTRDGRILFSRSEEPPNQGESNVWSMRVDERTGKKWGDPERLTSGPDWKPVINMSDDGKRAVFIRTNIAPTIYVADVNSRTREIGRLQRLTLDERQNRPYEWTPDGKSVLYTSDREGESRIFRQEIGAATPEPVSGVKGSPIILRLNPERTEILYLTEAEREDARQRGGRDAGAEAGRSENAKGHEEFNSRSLQVMHIPLRGGEAQTVVEDSGINNFQCARGPSRECVYSKFAKDALVFMHFDSNSGAKKELLRVSDPEWQFYNWSLSPDGKTLALAKKMRISEESEVRLLATRDGAARVLKVKGWQGISTIDWAADGKSLWASAMEQGQTRVLISIDLQGHARAVLQESKPNVGWAIPSQDGKRLAIWETSGASNAWMLERF